MTQVDLYFNIEHFMEEEEMGDEKNWAVLVDGVSFPGLSKKEADVRVEELRAEGKKAIATEILVSDGKTQAGRSRVLTVRLSITDDESGLPLGIPPQKLLTTRWSDGWTVKREKPQEGEEDGFGVTRRLAVIDWFYKNR